LMPRRCRREPPARMRVLFLRPPPFQSSVHPLARLGSEHTDDQVQPFDLEPGLLEIEIRLRPGGVQATMLVGVEQAVEVEVGRPLVLGLKDGLGVVQPDPPDVPGELTIGPRQVLCGGTEALVRRVDLLDERVAGYRLLLSSGIIPSILAKDLLDPRMSRQRVSEGSTLPKPMQVSTSAGQLSLSC
jgi:hypothetical protein